MQYVDFSDTATLAERERLAYISGNTAEAAMLAQLQDHAETIEGEDTRLENARELAFAEGKAEGIAEAKAELAEAVQPFLNDLTAIADNKGRVDKQALADIYTALESRLS